MVHLIKSFSLFWALSLTFLNIYYIRPGRVPFAGLTMQQILMQVCVKRALPAEITAAEVPPPLQALLRRCTAFAPEDRPTAAVMAADLEQLAQVGPSVHGCMHACMRIKA